MDYPTQEIAVKNEFFDLLNLILRPNDKSRFDYKIFMQLFNQFFNANPFFDIDAQDGQGRTALSLFCENTLKAPRFGHNTIHTLLKLGANVNSFDYNGYTPIMHAVSAYENMCHKMKKKTDLSFYIFHHQQNIMHLLEYEPNLSFSRCHHNALTLIQDEKLKFFLNDFERTRIQRLNETAYYTKCNQMDFLTLKWRDLCRAIKNKNTGDIEHIVRSVPEIIHMRSQDHSSFLHTATFFKNKDAVQYFLDKGVDPTVRNSRGETPLYIACQKDALEIANIFSDQFTDVSPFRKTPSQSFLSRLNFKPCMAIDEWWPLIENNLEISDQLKVQSMVIEILWPHPQMFTKLVREIGKSWSYEDILEKSFKNDDILKNDPQSNIKELLKSGYKITCKQNAKKENVESLRERLIPDAQKMNLLDALGETTEEIKKRKM